MKGLRMAIPLCLVCGLLCACKPSGVDSKTYDAAKDMVSVMDDYLDFKISWDEMKERFDRCSQRSISSQNETEYEQMRLAQAIHLAELDLQLAELEVGYGETPLESSVISARNELAKAVNMSER